MLSEFHNNNQCITFIVCGDVFLNCLRVLCPHWLSQQCAMFYDYFFVILKGFGLTLQPSREDCVLRLFFSQCSNINSREAGLQWFQPLSFAYYMPGLSRVGSYFSPLFQRLYVSSSSLRMVAVTPIIFDYVFLAHRRP